MELLVVNARMVLGRKADVADAGWIADVGKLRLFSNSSCRVR